MLAVDDLDRAAACYEELGFTLTPRASHPDTMGTANRLAQFAGRNFIELLAVDRPDRLEDHDFTAEPKRFSFGAHNKAFLRMGNGMSMLALAGTDSRADVRRFDTRGIDTYAAFDFERTATLPDGSQARVGFTLAFATSSRMPSIAFFVCENRFPQYFWKPEFQSHRNGAQSIAAVYIEADNPESHVDFLTEITGSVAQPIDGGQRIRCGTQDILVMTSERIRRLAPGRRREKNAGPLFAGVAITSAHAVPHVVPAEQAYGIFIEWR
ncbi:MAG: VOC family protein [Hyphomicrobiaceae bacterium]